MTYLIIDPDDATPIVVDGYSNPAAPGAIGLSLATMRAEIIAMMSGREDVTPTRIDFWINRAYLDLATSTSYDELQSSIGFTTVADQSMYLLPDMTVTTMFLSRVDASLEAGGVPLEKIDLGAYRRRRILDDASGAVPSVFFRQGRVLVLDPMPFTAWDLVLDFSFEPNELVEDTDCPILRPKWHEAIVWLAYNKILKSLNQWEAAIVIKNEFTDLVRAKEDDGANEQKNQIISSSVPRSHHDLTRRQVTRGGTSGLYE